MIRFFRTLRQRLLGQNRVSKYLLYAVGEIVLVVIGILIALQVNNWNEQRHEWKLERSYLTRLYKDLEGDLAGFRKLQAIFVRKKEFLSKLQEETTPDFGNRNPESWLEGLYASRYISLPTVRSATFDELAGSGRLTLIRDLELRSALANYYAEYALMSRILQEPVGDYKQIVYEVFPGSLLNEWRTRKLIPNMDDFENGYKALTEHPGFESAVNSELAYTGDLLYYSNVFIDSVQGLLKKLDLNMDQNPDKPK